MSEPTSDFCTAYGCPLIGVYGGGIGKWYCFCHHNNEGGSSDAITAELHRQKLTVDRIMAARRHGRPDMQLENGLIEITQEIGRQRSMPSVGVIGPEYAAPHYTEQEQ